MKYLNIACGLLMILFVGVQYNDPDGLLWAAIYLVPAIWAGILAFRPHLIQKTLPFGLLGLSVSAVTGRPHPDFGARTCGGTLKPRAKAWAS